MGLSRDELFDVLRGAIVELAKASGIHADPSTYPALARLVAFDAEVESGRRYELERGQREWEEEQAGYRREYEAAVARRQRDVERLITQHAANPTADTEWALRQAGVMPSHQPGHAQVLTPR